jgi:hypothetical protein
MSASRDLDELSQVLGIAHRAYLAQKSANESSTGQTLETHWLVRRLIEKQPAKSADDLHVLLNAANLARELDPSFAYDEPGSCVSLLRKALAAIEQQHSQDQRSADDLLAKLQNASR